MKLRYSFLTALLGLALLSVNAVAQYSLSSLVSVPTAIAKNGAGGTSVDVVFGAPENPFFPKITYLKLWTNAGGTTNQVNFYGATEFTRTTSAALSTATNLSLDAVGNLASNDVVVIDLGGGTAYSKTVYGVSGTTLSLTATTGVAVPAGSKVYRMSDTMTIFPWSTNYTAEGDLFSGRRGAPLVVRAVGSTTCRVDTVTVQYFDY